MLISRGDIVLCRVNFQDIELIRKWRNSDEIKTFMEHREYISQQQQSQWFNQVNNRNNLYFLIKVKHEPVGLIFGAGINWENNFVSNAGIFIADRAYRENTVALFSSILLNDFAFALGMQRIYIKVLNDNRIAKRYNLLLGYKILPDQLDTYNQKYVLTYDAYLMNRKNIAGKIKINDNFKVVIESETFDTQFPEQPTNAVYAIRELLTTEKCTKPRAS
jgi:UDP-4-amino-4,6-dideoxy-N-acetyl-beta-L-altrosamine N-acetyltransferase